MDSVKQVQDLVGEAKLLLVKGDKYQAYRRLLMLEDRVKTDREFWTAWLALSRTLDALREACWGGP